MPGGAGVARVARVARVDRLAKSVTGGDVEFERSCGGEAVSEIAGPGTVASGVAGAGSTLVQATAARIAKVKNKKQSGFIFGINASAPTMIGRGTLVSKTSL